MSGLLSFKNPKTQYGVVLDVGSKSVGGGIFQLESGNIQKLVYITRERIPFQQVFTGEGVANAMFQSLDTVLGRLEGFCLKPTGLETTSRIKIASTHVVLSSLWHVSETRTLHLTRTEPLVVTKELVDKLLATEEEEFAANVTAEDKAQSPDVLLFERKIIEMRLNGYATAEPYGKKASTVDVLLFSSLAPKNTLEKIKKSVTARFSTAQFEFHTFSLAALVAIRNAFPKTEHFLAVQVGGELTDITIVKKGVIAETMSFPMGHNQLLRALSGICGNYPNCTIEGLVGLHRDDAVQTGDKALVEQAIGETRTAWLGLFNDAISNFSQETFLPNTVFLFEDDSYASLFGEFLSTEESSRFTVTAEPFSVHALSEHADEPFVKGVSKDSRDSLLEMEAYFAAGHLKLEPLSQ